MRRVVVGGRYVGTGVVGRVVGLVVVVVVVVGGLEDYKKGKLCI